MTSQNLRVFAHLYGIARAERGDVVERGLGLANLIDRAVPVARHAGREAVEVYGSQAGLADVEAAARADGVRGPRSDGPVDLVRLGALVVCGLLMWRVAIHAMTRRLID